MKHYFLYILLSIVPISYNNTANTQDHIVTISKGKYFEEEGLKYYKLPVTLTNTTKDTLHYLSMTCSWQDYYHTDNAALQPERVQCDKNIPERISVPPGKSNTVVLNLVIQSTDSIHISFRIGHNIIIVDSKYAWIKKWRELEKGKNIIWSNPITIKLK